MTDPIEAAIEAGLNAVDHKDFRGYRTWDTEDVRAAIRAAAPILIQHGRELERAFWLALEGGRRQHREALDLLARGEQS